MRVIHAAPDVGRVDVYAVAADGTPSRLLDDLDFGVAAEPIDVPAGAYTVGVDVDDDAAPDLYFELFELAAAPSRTST
ncbi:MAG TPA: DUF4397 domain-containing protein [Sandaracinaceae bacterium]